MFNKRNTARRRMWHVISIVGVIAAVVIAIASADKTGNSKILYLIISGILLLAAFPGVMDSLESPCTVCGGVGVIAGGSWTLPFEANDCAHCNGTGIEPVDIYQMHGGHW